MWKHCLGKNRSAAVLHAGLRILFPGALQPFGAIKPTAGVLGVHLRLVSLGTSIQSVGKGCVYSVVYWCLLRMFTVREEKWYAVMFLLREYVLFHLLGKNDVLQEINREDPWGGFWCHIFSWLLAPPQMESRWWLELFSRSQTESKVNARLNFESGCKKYPCLFFSNGFEHLQDVKTC